VSKNLGNVPSQEKMSEEQEQAFTNGINKGRKLEREEILKRLADYLALTEFSEQVEGATPNPEWTAGFNAALSLVNKGSV
jgi:hypothetical protein